jgi:hypothetical protein
VCCLSCRFARRGHRRGRRSTVSLAGRSCQPPLRKELEDFKARFDGIDPDEVKKLAEEKRKLELLAQGHKPEELDRLVGERIKGLKADWDKQLSTVTGERDSLTSRLTAIQIDQGVLTVATDGDP